MLFLTALFLIAVLVFAAFFSFEDMKFVGFLGICFFAVVSLISIVWHFVR